MDKTKFVLAFIGFMLVEFWVILGIILSSKKTYLDKEDNILVIRPTYFELFVFAALLNFIGVVNCALIGFEFYQSLLFVFCISSILIWVKMFRGINTIYVFDDNFIINKHLMRQTETIPIIDIKQVNEVIGHQQHYFSMRYFDTVNNRTDVLDFYPNSIRDIEKLRVHLQANDIPFKVINRRWP